MKKANSLKLFFLLALFSATTNLYATNYAFGPFSQDVVLTFDITPTAYWSDFYVKPPIGHENYVAGHFQTRLVFGPGTVLIYNSDYQSGLAATNFIFNTDGTKYNFRISFYTTTQPATMTVEAKQDGATNWIVLFDKMLQAYGSVPIGTIENFDNTPGFLNITNISATALISGITPVETDKIGISPNLVENTVNISSISDIYNVKFYSETGSLIKSISLNENKKATVDLQNFKRGIYFIHLQTKDGNYVKRFIKK